MRLFHYVYVLRSLRDGRFCVGATKDLKKRIELHNAGAITSNRPRRPFESIFYEAYRNEYDAKRRETYLKTTKGKTALRTMLQQFLNDSGRSTR